MRTFTTYPGRDALLRHTRVGAQFNDIPGSYIHSETKMNLVFAQYLVHCLDTENVCHHITTMDHPPREMKETLFARHNQTVIPLLSNTKKASLQAVHTSFVNTAVDNMTDNIILNCRPPPINDEETYLTRRQRATLLQLRSGH